MGFSNSFLHGFHKAFPLRDFVYLLQLEEYETLRYVERLVRFFFRRGLERRDALKWTVRASMVAVMTVVMIFVFAAGVGVATRSLLVVLVILIVGSVGLPIIVLVGNVMTKPLFVLGHRMVWRRATARVISMPRLKVVVVAGSHGKTTTKNLINDMIRFTYVVQLIGGNINTTTGIAQWILKNLQPSTEVLIVEMDAYHIGEIAASCHITPPDIAVLTSIGDQHLARFGSQEKITRGLGEVFTPRKSGLLRICGSQTAHTLRSGGMSFDLRVIDAPVYHETILPCEKMSVSVKEDVAYAAAVADAIDVPLRFIEAACRAFVPPERRQRPAEVFGYVGIDDSYNISNATARAGVLAGKALAAREGKKLVVLTAGIPELPRLISAEQNVVYGAFLASHADAIVLLESEFAPFVRRGLNEAKYASARNITEAVAQLKANFPSSDFVLLFQPELTDASY